MSARALSDRSTRSVALALAIAAIAAAHALGGCAELARSTPSIALDASATRRARAWSSDGGETVSSRESWSWSIGVGVRGRFGSGAPVMRLPRELDPPAPAAPLPCRISIVCRWEAQARGRAIERARARIVEEAQR